MQFHITGRCNLACKHCYRNEGNIEPLAFEDVKMVIEQYETLRLRYNEEHRINSRGHINITGGEPFIREDIREILELFERNKDKFTFGILSNGSFLDDSMIELLKKTKVAFVQLSIDGKPEKHDEMRATGDFERTFKIATKLESSGIKTYISFTANKLNYKDFYDVASMCRKKRITKLWSDRLVPIGNGSELIDIMIKDDSIYDYLNEMKKAQGNRITSFLFPKTEIAMNRALQFLKSDERIYSCSAGNSLITVDEFGQIMPCRRMPIICGNVFDATLEEVYYGNEIMKRLRKRCIPDECIDCQYNYYCRGGAKCQSYALYGDFERADPACPIKV